MSSGAVVGSEVEAGPEGGEGGEGSGGGAAVSKRGGREGGLKGCPAPKSLQSSRQPGKGSPGPGTPSLGSQGSGEAGRQCRPHGRCGPWHLPGTSACRSQSAVTREEGRERATRGDKKGDTGEMEDETRMSSLDACLLDLAVQGLGLPLVTTP